MSESQSYSKYSQLSKHVISGMKASYARTGSITIPSSNSEFGKVSMLSPFHFEVSIFGVKGPAMAQVSFNDCL